MHNMQTPPQEKQKFFPETRTHASLFRFRRSRQFRVAAISRNGLAAGFSFRTFLVPDLSFFPDRG